MCNEETKGENEDTKQVSQNDKWKKKKKNEMLGRNVWEREED